MAKKITWTLVYKDFKEQYPRLGKEAIAFKPYSYATIVIMFSGKPRKLYNYDTKELSEVTLAEW